MATAALATTLNSPISHLRPLPMEWILVIEADSALRKILRWLLSSEGFEVEVVADAVVGLEMLRRRVPHAVILDLPRPRIFRA